MSKFTTGLLFGAISGAAVALLTAKSTGNQKQAAVSNYLKDLTDATETVSTNLDQLKRSVNTLATDGVQTAASVVKDITAAVNDFQFQAQPRIDSLNEHVEKLQDDLAESGVNLSISEND